MRSSFLKRFVASGSTLVVALSGAVVLTAAPASAAPVVTDFGFQSHAFGTSVISNNVELNTGRTAVAWISCTRLAGLNPSNRTNASNYLAATGASEANPFISLGAMTSATRTFRDKAKGIVGITAVNKIADVTLSGPSLSDGAAGPELRLSGLATRATSFAQGGALKAETAMSSASMQLSLPTGTPIEGTPLEDLVGAVDEGIGAVTEVLEQAEGQAIEVPGLGMVRLGTERVAERRSYASAVAIALVVDLAGADGELNTQDDSTIQIGKSRTRIDRNLPAGVMNGFGHALDLSAADGLLKIGRVGVQVLPCRGTNGDVRGVTVPAQDLLEGALELGALRGLVYGLQRQDGTGLAWTQGKVSELALGSGDSRVEVKGIVGVATVRKKASGAIVRSIQGSTVGSLLIDGEEQRIPTDGAPLELPGLGKIEFNITEKHTRGISVTAVRITLNPGEGSETVINLGNARAFLKPA